jgi:thiamine transporter ThiT
VKLVVVPYLLALSSGLAALITTTLLWAVLTVIGAEAYSGQKQIAFFALIIFMAHLIFAAAIFSRMRRRWNKATENFNFAISIIAILFPLLRLLLQMLLRARRRSA